MELVACTLGSDLAEIDERIKEETEKQQLSNFGINYQTVCLHALIVMYWE